MGFVFAWKFLDGSMPHFVCHRVISSYTNSLIPLGVQRALQTHTHTRTLTHTNTHMKPLHRQTHTHTNTHSLSFQQSHQFVGSNAYSYTQPECLLHKYIGRRGIFKAFVNISFSITVYSIEYSEDTDRHTLQTRCFCIIISAVARFFEGVGLRRLLEDSSHPVGLSRFHVNDQCVLGSEKQTQRYDFKHINRNKFVGDVSFKWTSKNKKETQELWTEIIK